MQSQLCATERFQWLPCLHAFKSNEQILILASLIRSPSADPYSVLVVRWVVRAAFLWLNGVLSVCIRAHRDAPVCCTVCLCCLLCVSSIFLQSSLVVAAVLAREVKGRRDGRI